MLAIEAHPHTKVWVFCITKLSSARSFPTLHTLQLKALLLMCLCLSGSQWRQTARCMVSSFPQLPQCVEIVQLGWVLLSTRGAPHCFWLGTIKALQSGEVVVLFQLLECGTVELTRS